MRPAVVKRTDLVRLPSGCVAHPAGHPSFVMSCSFTNQVIAQLELWNECVRPLLSTSAAPLLATCLLDLWADAAPIVAYVLRNNYASTIM
jgi:S-adenosyl-L-homocysteine hydrolase